MDTIQSFRNNHTLFRDVAEMAVVFSRVDCFSDRKYVEPLHETIFVRSFEKVI